MDLSAPVPRLLIFQEFGILKLEPFGDGILGILKWRRIQNERTLLQSSVPSDAGRLSPQQSARELLPRLPESDGKKSRNPSANHLYRETAEAIGHAFTRSAHDTDRTIFRPEVVNAPAGSSGSPSRNYTQNQLDIHPSEDYISSRTMK
jgi:hypothetical protein